MVAEKNFSNVVLLGRRVLTPFPGLTAEQTARVTQRVVNFDALKEHGNEFENAAAVMWCLGTQRGKVESEAEFERIDKGFALTAAREARDRNVSHFALVSSTGADPSSMFFYLRCKGETEQALIAMHFPFTTILRPGLLIAEREEMRWGEVLFRPFLYLWSSSRPVHVATVARAMLRNVLQPRQPVTILENRDVHQLGGE